MRLSKEAEQYLIPVAAPGKWVQDEYDVSLADILVPVEEDKKVDAAILGIPYDTSVMGRRGCKFGPKGIRDALVFCDLYDAGVDVDLSVDFSVKDYGNVDVMQTDVLETHRRVELIVDEIFKTGATPVIIGGDHSLAYPDIKALINNIDGKVGVINIDGHLDVRISHHGEISSGTPFRRLIEEPKERPLDPKNFVEFGINGWLNSRFYMDYCRDMGITVMPARQIHKRGIEDAVNEALAIAGDGTDAIFLSIDIDGLDLSCAPGTCAPNAGGLMSWQALEAVWMIGQHPKTRGMDLLEVAPDLDAAGVTSIMSAGLIMNFLGATKKRLKG
jgi:formimidoylglutamase